VKATPDEVMVLLPLAVRSLRAAAVRQVVCTAAYVEGGGTAEVTVLGPDGTLPPERCPTDG
jgi:hypothetical protein